MRRFLIAFFAVFAITACSPFDDSDIWDKLNEHEQRIARLEALCEQMNTNISALQTIVTALQNNDYITSISPIYEGSEEIGYVITFSKSGKITIYHGRDGQDGETPIIGVRQDPKDGIHYWTLNGEWLLDENGNRIRAIGQDGEDGQDGITPQFKIEDEYWYISYDNGQTWTRLGKTTGEDGKDGDSFFQNVDYTSNPDYVIFTLADGTQIKVPTWSAFEALKALVEQANKNIEALQAIVTALQNNDYVVSVTPIYNGSVEIGYTIKFSKSGNVTIFHGQDGQNGYTPQIGVSLDSDGKYYWTLDGEWMLDDAGNKIPATGEDGSNGENGNDGANGQDGITPLLKIENNYWYVSYDKGASWLQLGKATGADGAAGEDGVDGDSFFQSVTEDDTCVYLVLADGTELVIPKYPQEAVTLALGQVTGFTATFYGEVFSRPLDLKVTVYYGTTSNISVYKHKGSQSVTEFPADTFSLKLTSLAARTQYYYFIEVIANGQNTYSEIMTFNTGEPDPYVDWGEGENVGGEI